MEVDLRADDWHRASGVAVRGRAFAGGDDGRVLEGNDLAERFADRVGGGVSERRSDDARALSRTVGGVADGLEGFFAAVVEHPSGTVLVADGARSIPLFYAEDGTAASDRGRVVRRLLGAEINRVTESEFLLTRYVTGPETIWAGVSAVQPGEVIAAGTDGVERHTYRELTANRDEKARARGEAPAARGERASLEHLRSGFERALDRLETVAGDRPVVIALSGGYDSRLLAAGLVARGREVIGFTFGKSGHPDVEVSREVADRLGIRWELATYDEDRWTEWYHGEACTSYRDRAFGGDALPFLAAWPALGELLSDGRLPAKALYCPGHTVATPSERLPRFVGEASETGAGSTRTIGCGPAVEAGGRPDRPVVEPTLDSLVEYVLDAHYDLWKWDDPAFERSARERIERGLLDGRADGSIDDPASASAAYERWEWRGRMSTFTNGDVRLYEDRGVSWWLPLWDPAYVRAWTSIPHELRREKYAHAELAVEYYREVADVPTERARVTDRSLSPADRHLSLVRHSPARQFTERGGSWDPPFLVPRERWTGRESHPLGWYGAVDPDLLDRLSDSRNFYALRTLAETGRLDLADPTASAPTEPRIALPTPREGRDR